jgi:hypothetical protein
MGSLITLLLSYVTGQRNPFQMMQLATSTNFMEFQLTGAWK